MVVGDSPDDLEFRCDFCGRLTDGGPVCDRCEQEVFDAEQDAFDDGGGV